MWDLIIIGGGPAGTSTALHLATIAPELASKTLILEKERYPREKYCAGGLGMRALTQLKALNLSPTAPSVPIQKVELFTTQHRLTVAQPDFGVVVRRLEFDHWLAKEVRSRGMSLREGAKVVKLAPGGSGVQLWLEDGEILEAKAVVGADGVGSVVRKEGGFSGGSLRAQVVELDTPAVEGDPARDTLRFDSSMVDFQGYAWDFPTLVNQQPLICRGFYLIRTLGEGNLRELLQKYLEKRGLNIKDYRLKAFGERGFSPGEPISKERLMLVGEAAGIDIATGEGIAQAIAYGALAAPYLKRCFEKNDFSFQDWKSTVLNSGLGHNLLVRYLIYWLGYGKPFTRHFTGGLLAHNPHLLKAYAEDFAGAGPGAGTLLKTSLWSPYSTIRALAEGLFPG